LLNSDFILAHRMATGPTIKLEIKPDIRNRTPDTNRKAKLYPATFIPSSILTGIIRSPITIRDASIPNSEIKNLLNLIIK